MSAPGLRYVVVEGPIGVGKTTLCRLLCARWGAKPVLEEVDENPFLHSFYRDRRSHAFQTQVFFLLSRFRQQQTISQLDLFSDRVVSDYMFAKDRIFASINLVDDEFSLYLKLAELLETGLPRPDLVVYLQASVDVLMERIARRGRYYERDISRDYLGLLTEAYNEYFFRMREQSALIVNASDSDFSREGPDLEDLLGAIESHPGGTTTFVSRSSGGC